MYLAKHFHVLELLRLVLSPPSRLIFFSILHYFEEKLLEHNVVWNTSN